MSKYTNFVKSLSCCHCGSPADDPHHIIGVDKMGMMGKKNHDITTMPLCRECHNEVHLGPGAYPQTRWMIETQIKAIKAGILVL